MVLLLEKDDKFYFDGQLLAYIMGNIDKQALLMLQDYDPAVLCDSSGSTLLHHSAKCGNASMTQYFIDRGCRVDAKDNSESTPLMLAVENNCVATIKVLIEAGADIHASRGTDDSLLKEVIRSCMGVHFREESKTLDLIRQHILDQFLRRFSDDFVDDTQGMVKLLLDINCPLHHVVRVLKDTTATRYYLASSCPVDVRECEKSCTPLQIAVSTDDIANVKVLLEHGADVNAKDRDGKGVLFYYSKSEVYREEKLELLRILMESGSCLSSPVINGITPVEYLLNKAHKEIVPIVIQYADPMAKYGIRERTVLHLLSMNLSIEKDIEEFELLARRYFDVNASDSEGNTALGLAIKYRRPERVDFMLKKGANLDAFNAKGTTFKDIISRWWKIPDKKCPCVKILEIFLLHGGDLDNEFSKFKSIFGSNRFEESNLAQLLMAHFVLAEARGHKLRFRSAVDARPVLAKVFNDYKLQLEEMKSMMVYDSITMYELVTADDKKLTHFAANEDIMSKFGYGSEGGFYSELYYTNYVKRRMDRAAAMAKHQRKAALVIVELTGLRQHVILDQIISYLRIPDLRSLFLV